MRCTKTLALQRGTPRGGHCRPMSGVSVPNRTALANFQLRGRPPVPTKAIWRQLAARGLMVLVDEFRTSIICCACHHAPQPRAAPKGRRQEGVWSAALYEPGVSHHVEPGLQRGNQHRPHLVRVPPAPAPARRPSPSAVINAGTFGANKCWPYGSHGLYNK